MGTMATYAMAYRSNGKLDAPKRSDNEMEALILAIGTKTCCIAAAGTGGVTNWVVNRAIRWFDLLAACLLGWIAAELFIPPIMVHFDLHVTWGPAIAFVIGYSGIRLLPVVEARLHKMIKG